MQSLEVLSRFENAFSFLGEQHKLKKTRPKTGL